MHEVRFRFIWKFLATTGIIILLITTFLTIKSQKSQKTERIDHAIGQLSQIAKIGSVSIPGSKIAQAISSGNMKTDSYNEATQPIKNQFQILNQWVEDFKIANISILIPNFSEKKVQYFYSTHPSFRFMDFSTWYPEIEEVIGQNKVTLKEDYSEGGQKYYSAFSPIYNESQQIVAVLRVDMRTEEIFKNSPGFWGRYILYVFLSLLLALLISSILSRMVTSPIDRFVSFVNRVSEGQYHLRYENHSYDEMEKIAYALNLMLEKLEGLIETEADRDRLQEQITNLLQIVTAAANGDFRVSAEVTADTLGALADSFNLMISELSKLIRDAQRASEQISKSTNEILKSSEIMAIGAGKQAQDIDSIHNAAKEMADIIKYANERSVQAARAASRAASVALQGRETVKRSIEGMHRIRETVQKTARQVRLLGESSQEIGEILEVISDIANRTNLLGLNATIEAARASEAGRGFAVVADEVRNLAERSSQAAKDIAVLIESIQAGTSEAVTAMEHGTVEVEQETRRVDEAGSALKEILDVAEESANIIKEISEAFGHQTKASSDIAKAMERIASIAQETAGGAQKSKRLSEDMSNLSRILSVAVSKFRLPRNRIS